MLFLYGSEPDPLFMERAASVQKSGAYQVKFVYWQRGATTNLYYPFSNLLGAGHVIPVSAGDPRGGLLRRVLFSLIFTLKLALRVWRIRPDIIYAVNINMCFSARLVTLVWPRARMVYEFQDQFGVKLSGIKRWLYRWSVARVRLTILQSPASEKFIADNRLEAVSAPKIVVPPAPAGWDYQYQPNLARAELVVGYFGNFRGRAILESLVSAAERANAAGGSVRLQFGGTGEEVEYIRRAAAEHSFVDYIGKFEYHTDYMDLFRAIDVSFAVFPQANVTFKHHVARRFAEAVASGMPVIVGAGTHMASVAERTGCGWVVTEADADELAALFAKLCKDRSLLGVAGRVDAEIKREYRYETHEPKLLAALSEVLK